MSRSRFGTIVGEVLIGTAGGSLETPGYAATIAATGIDPASLFAQPPMVESGKCSCLWVGHSVYGFKDLGGEGGRLSRTYHS